MSSFDALQPRILLVDDNTDNLNLMRLFLSSAYHVDEASNGREALDRFSASPYDLVFMDLEMPVLDGYAATQAIRALELREKRPPTPILVLTAHALDEMQDRCQEAGCTGFLVKPVRKAAILAVVDQLLNRGGGACGHDGAGAAATTTASSCLLVDKNRLRQLLPLFFDTAGATLEAAREALSQGDLDGARRQGHKLKGSALSYGFEAIGRAAMTLEEAGETGDVTSASVALQQALRLLDVARRTEA